MEAETVRKVITNLRNPVNVKERIHFTARSVLFLAKLFDGKKIDTIELHYVLLRMAFISGCFRGSTVTKYINLKDLVVYLYSDTPSCITNNDIQSIADIFTTDNDSDYREVKDMKIIVMSLM